VLICLDPGHGGTDPGAVVNDVREADVALDYARAIGEALETRGCMILYTRLEDDTLDLSARARAANEAGAGAFISVHCNASTSTAPHGFQVFHAATSARGEALGRAIYNRVAAAIGTTRWSGVHPDESPACGGRRLYVLRATVMPAVLLELGFLTHAGERLLLLRPDYRELLARAIADGIADWAGEGVCVA